VSAFDTAMAALIADPHLAVEAIYRAGGNGPPVALHVLRSSPDRVADAFGTSILQGSDILVVPVAALPGWSAGDSFTLGSDVLTVQHAERDATGTAWRVVCQR
jgi:hypothetical protein